MKNVKWIAAAALLFFGAGISNAQETTKAPKDPKDPKEQRFDPERDDKIDKLKIAFITTELNLTTSEAEKFWPIYNEQENKLKEIRKAMKDPQKAKESFDSMTDAEAKKLLEQQWDNMAKENSIRKEYSEKFITLLGAKRTLKLMHVEHEFRRELLERLKDQHRPFDGPPHPGFEGPRPQQGDK